jgi:hypothetical protein
MWGLGKVEGHILQMHGVQSLEDLDELIDILTNPHGYQELKVTSTLFLATRSARKAFALGPSLLKNDPFKP